MKVYLRKIFDHDVTHEVSVTETIILQFFDDQRDNLLFVRKGDVKGRKYQVCINKAKDARFGGEFKSLYKEDNVKEGDILIICKRPDSLFEMSVAHENTPIHDTFNSIFNGTERHAIVEIMK